LSATPLENEVLEKRTRILGKDHPDTLSTMNKLANTLGDQGKVDEAALMRREVPEKRTKILGEDHP
jgi:hypothetical protein